LKLLWKIKKKEDTNQHVTKYESNEDIFFDDQELKEFTKTDRKRNPHRPSSQNTHHRSYGHKKHLKGHGHKYNPYRPNYQPNSDSPAEMYYYINPSQDIFWAGPKPNHSFKTLIAQIAKLAPGIQDFYDHFLHIDCDRAQVLGELILGNIYIEHAVRDLRKLSKKKCKL